LELVRAVEDKWDGERIKSLLEKILPQKILGQADTLVLGCTHFPLIKNQIQEVVGRKIKIIDSGEAVAKRTLFLLKENNLLAANGKKV
jgi:glutamate racemase